MSITMELQNWDESTDITDEQCASPPINPLKMTKTWSNPLVYNKGMPKDQIQIIEPEFPRMFKKLTLKQSKELKSHMVTYNPRIMALQEEIKMEGSMVKHNKQFSSTKILCVMNQKY